MSCLGCQLANNEISTYSIYEDDTVNVILDIFPFSHGHLLILPKEHYPSFDDMPVEVHHHINKIALYIKPILMKAMNATSIIFVQNDGALNSLDHYHLHLIPHTDEDLSTLYDQRVHQDNSEAKLQEILKTIKQYL